MVHITLMMRRVVVPLVQSISGTATGVLDAIAITITRIDAIAHVGASTTPGRVRGIPNVLALVLVLVQTVGGAHSLAKIDIGEIVDRSRCTHSAAVEEN